MNDQSEQQRSVLGCVRDKQIYTFYYSIPKCKIITSFATKSCQKSSGDLREVSPFGFSLVTGKLKVCL